MPEWKELTPVEGSCACLTCGCGAREHLPMDRWVAVGFGAAGYERDGVRTQTEPFDDDDPDAMLTVADVERMAAADPDHDWRIYFYAPLYEAEYQRHRNGAWVLVKKGDGFA